MSCRFTIALATVALAACGGADQPPAPTPSSRTASVAAPPSPSRTTTPQAARPGCDVEIDIECPAGLEDGCARVRTTTSACVLFGATALEPCHAGTLLQCPAGMIDGCEGQPPYSDRHICVRP